MEAFKNSTRSSQGLLHMKWRSRSLSLLNPVNLLADERTEKTNYVKNGPLLSITDWIFNKVISSEALAFRNSKWVGDFGRLVWKKTMGVGFNFVLYRFDWFSVKKRAWSPLKVCDFGLVLTSERNSDVYGRNLLSFPLCHPLVTLKMLENPCFFRSFQLIFFAATSTSISFEIIQNLWMK